MIVVEGPDGAGKTTLVRELMDATGLPVAPRVVSKETDALVDLKYWTERNVQQGFQRTIFDRHRLISEPIYGAIMRQVFEPGFDSLEWFADVSWLFYDARPIIIYCIPPFEVVKYNVENDPDNSVVAEHIKAIWGLYMAKAVTDLNAYPLVWIYDYTDSIGDEVLNNITKSIQERIANV